MNGIERIERWEEIGIESLYEEYERARRAILENKSRKHLENEDKGRYYDAVHD